MPHNKIIAIIPARGGSKSIPRKNMRPLHGKPLVAWPIQLAQSIPNIERIIVSSDDEEIITTARRYGAETPFVRPKKLANDDTPTLPVLEHCLAFLKTEEHYSPDIIILLYPTAPFLKKEYLKKAIKMFETDSCNSVLGVIKDLGRFWKHDDINGTYLPFYPSASVNRQYYMPLYRETGSLYISRYSVIMEMHKLIDEKKVQFILMNEDELIDIDTPEDFHKAEILSQPIL